MNEGIVSAVKDFITMMIILVSYLARIEIYELIKIKNPNLKIGFSKLASLHLK